MENKLLTDRDEIMHVPFLIKGRLIDAPQIDRLEIEKAFVGKDIGETYAKLPAAQVIREKIIDRRTMKYTGEYLYQVMPPVKAEDLLEKDFDRLSNTLYSLSVDEILDYLDTILAYLVKNHKLASQIAGLYRQTSEYSDALLEKWFASMTETLNRKNALDMIDRELSYGGKPGSHFLNGWVKIEGETGCIRAMPTRQLHITAGNVPEVPVISAMRAVLTKSAAVIKLPCGAILPGAMLAQTAYNAAPEHPITQNMSLVYWQGGDESIENMLFAQGAFDRIVVWGGPAAVAAVQNKTAFTKTISLDPRYSVSFIGKEAFAGKLEETAEKALPDVMSYNQKACTSSLVHYIEGTKEQADEYAKALQQALKRYGDKNPAPLSPPAQGQVKRMKRGRYADARWYLNYDNDDFISGAVVMTGEFDILDHPFSRLVIVRLVDKLDDALKYMSQNVSAVGVFPEERRQEMKDRILAHGVSSVLPLGQCEKVFAGMPHDGMMILNQLVDWKLG